MTWLALLLMGLADAAFSGYRAAAGRSLLIFKRAYYRDAMLRGLAAGAAALVLGGGIMAPAVAHAVARGVPLEQLELAARGMLLVWIPYALVIAAALAVRAIPSVDVRSMTSVLVFGPFTFLRPPVAVMGVLVAHSRLPDTALTVAAALAVSLFLLLETVLRVSIFYTAGEGN